ncbi:MAG: DUF6510 family protein [Micromonosporaceae bacterium]
MSPHDYTDGNELAGPLGELFTMDVTGAVGRCASCHRACAVAQMRVYHNAPGLVARCPSCRAVVLRLVRGPGRAWLDLRGTLSLQIPLPTEDRVALR